MISAKMVSESWYKLSSHRISPTLNYTAAAGPERTDWLVHWLVFNRQNHWLGDTRGGRALRRNLCTRNPVCTPPCMLLSTRSVRSLTVSFPYPNAQNSVSGGEQEGCTQYNRLTCTWGTIPRASHIIPNLIYPCHLTDVELRPREMKKLPQFTQLIK